MRHSIVVKFLVILLTAGSLVAAVGGGAGIVAMEGAGLYVNGLDELQDQERSSIAITIADAYAERYAAENLGSVPYPVLQDRYPDPTERMDAEHWTVLLAQDGRELESTGSVENTAYTKTYTVSPLYCVISVRSPEELEASAEETETAEQEAKQWAYMDPEVPEEYLYYSQERSWTGGVFQTYYAYYYQGPEYEVTVALDDKVLESSALQILTLMYPYRYVFIATLAVCILLVAAGLVFLCWSAGQTREGTVQPGGLNRLPLDIYALLAGGGIAGLSVLFSELCSWMTQQGPHPGNLSLLGVNLLAIALLGIGFFYAFTAQIKVRNNYWWTHSVTGFCTGKLWTGLRCLAKQLHSLVRMLPVIWQWLLTALILTLGTVYSYFEMRYNGFSRPVSELLFLLMLAVDTAAVLYGGYAFGKLILGAKRMARGELACKISTRYLFGSFRDFAQALNALSDTADLLAQKQLRSERMKTELITNVSHDIKTPLTSIINFVDLLQKPHSEQQQAEYLEVLARQSGRMKRLIEDLMDLSKANTGNMTVNLVEMDAEETVNQVLGEFSDKLAAVRLAPVFRRPEQRVRILADGRLVWRVMSNLLSNAVKYALPDTRLYVELQEKDGLVYLSLKNVSREALTVGAEELMERFVQGDASRNAEGSGLGLNIAQSLMEVQKGRLELSVDGDLFKVTLIFCGP